MVRISWESSLGAESFLGCAGVRGPCSWWWAAAWEALPATSHGLSHLSVRSAGLWTQPCPLQTWEVKVQTCKELEITLWNKKRREGVWTLQKEAGEKEGRREGRGGWGSVVVMKPSWRQARSLGRTCLAAPSAAACAHRCVGRANSQWWLKKDGCYRSGFACWATGHLDLGRLWNWSST